MFKLMCCHILLNVDESWADVVYIILGLQLR